MTRIVIPKEEWGEGAIVDWKNSRLIGASGKIYENVQVRREDVMRLWPPKKEN